MEKASILIIEDNPDTQKYLQVALSKNFEVFVCDSAVAGIEMAKAKKPALIVLDVMLPVISGFEACGLLKKDHATKDIPIIFLSSRNTVADITNGLGLGGDDYLVKPFDIRELVARIQARLRLQKKFKDEPRTLEIGDLKLSLEGRRVFVSGQPASLTPTEFDMLFYLASNPDKTFTRDQLIEELAGSAEPGAKAISGRTIDVHVRGLRKKVPWLQSHLIAVYGEGYKFVK
jgi:DNA-binding response OmpR family regulator